MENAIREFSLGRVFFVSSFSGISENFFKTTD
jgi:hypothetical protein